MESHLIALGSVVSAITQFFKGTGVLFPVSVLLNIIITLTAGCGK